MQVWGTVGGGTVDGSAGAGGFMYSDVLSKRLRLMVQPLTRFRQFCDAQLALDHGSGDQFRYNIYDDVGTQGTKLTESSNMPETSFKVRQGTGTVTEYGNSVPFSKKLDDLSLQPVTEIIQKLLKLDVAKTLDKEASDQFRRTPLIAVGTKADAASVVTFDEDGTVPSTGTLVVMSSHHVKIIADELSERDIPAYDDGGNYVGIFRPRALRALKNDLEAIHQYVSEGWHVIMNGEKGKYEGIRFVEQTHLAKVGSTAGVDEGFFIGRDTVVEAVATPEEIRGKIPTDYGRKKGIAWYALLGYKLIHDYVENSLCPNARVIRWFVSGDHRS